ncbi:hypothetical protein F5Y00DRAFT_128751 [Daldinia vernicosa]|uniref:uncharacterized protein n=1 Tax=Daldinia vernicosa TaxID=114800 RepID=UPI00200745CF|nr:uncharacterized protein F5Y00DRAFT_128751 [Daldinia vernicosa]KAI0846876.1 hypothetical protein F5Y00DRAFT_128751 [Daldinia vernicosa]
MALHMGDLSESDFTDDESPNWKNVVRRFTVNEKYDDKRTHYQNGQIGFRFVDEFCRFCESNKVDIVKMEDTDVELARERVEACLFDWPSDVHRHQVSANFEFKLAQSCEDQRALDKAALSSAVDPMHVEVTGLNPNYRAWSVVEDLSVDGYGMVPSRYLIPMWNQSKVPMRDYYVGNIYIIWISNPSSTHLETN